MAQSKNLPDPSVPSRAYAEMAPKWKRMDDLLGGTDAMRAAGPTYLPQHAAETDTAYNNRLNSTVLYNVVELTQQSLVGRVFREEMRLNEDVADEIVTLAKNIDMQDNDIAGFCTEWFSVGVAKGFAHALIDMPAINVVEGKVRTLADDKTGNNRPFWSLIQPENLFFAYFEKENGVDVLQQIRLYELNTELGPDGLTEIVHCDIRVIRVRQWEVWRNKYENMPNRKPEWEIIESGDYDLDVIPLVTFYTNKKGNMLSKPPLDDLTHLNVRHWQSTSDQINVLTVARFPMLAASGTQIEAGKSNSVVIGPRQLLSMRDPNGRFYYVEHSGKAIAAGKDELDSLVDQMSAYGSEFLRRQIAGRTAFERNADSSEATSPLKRMAIDFKGAVERAMRLTAMWLGVDPDKAGTVTINTKFTEISETAATGTILGDARKRMDLSRRTFISEMVRTGQIDQTIDPDEEIARIRAESAEGPMSPSFISATETIRATENIEGGASASDVVDGNTKTAVAPAGSPPLPARTKPGTPKAAKQK